MSSKTTGQKTEHRAVSAIRRLAVVAALALAACATKPPATPVPDALLHDQLFSPPIVAVDASQVFAMSPLMRRYFANEIATQVKARGVQGALIEAVHNKAQLRLEYDAGYTRNASEAFEARTGKTRVQSRP